MTVSVQQVSDYVGAEPTEVNDVARCLNAAVVLISAYIGSTVIPTDILDQCTLDVAFNLYMRQTSVSGSPSQMTFDAPGMGNLVPRDPLTIVYPLLNRYVMPF